VDTAAWLALQHPSYLAMEVGLASVWMDDTCAACCWSDAAACKEAGGLFPGERGVIYYVRTDASFGGGGVPQRVWGGGWVTPMGGRAVMGH
jgi:hypothetical protein